MNSPNVVSDSVPDTDIPQSAHQYPSDEESSFENNIMLSSTQASYSHNIALSI